MKRSISLSLNKGVSKSELQEFLDEVPDGIEIRTNVSIVHPDRFNETAQANAELHAEWDGTRQEIIAEKGGHDDAIH